MPLQRTFAIRLAFLSSNIIPRALFAQRSQQANRTINTKNPNGLACLGSPLSTSMSPCMTNSPIDYGSEPRLHRPGRVRRRSESPHDAQ
jgi:hypothetical protein